VNCRPVGGEGNEGAAGHCAVRVADSQRQIDQTIELIPTSVIRGTNAVHWSSGSGNARTAKYNAGTWAKVAVPAGMSSVQFDNALLGSALRQTGLNVLQPYGAGGAHNSNHFVYATVTGADGVVPGAPSQGFTLGAPGLCGGGGLSTGDQCSP